MAAQEQIAADLAALEGAGLLRRPHTIHRRTAVEADIDGRRAILFCSNDYLGFSHHPTLARALRSATDEDGVGSGASRLICGTHPVHLEAERHLADLVRRPAALLFSTGYAANVGALPALLGRGDVAFSDRLNHASLIDGLRLSRAEVHVYEHGDVDHLRTLLARHRAEFRRAWVVSDTVFSMDGDIAPIADLRAACDDYAAGLYVDEAHALGVLGEGRGLCAELGVSPDALVGTLGKAAGVAGAFVAGTSELRTLLENRARSYVFSTAPPAALAHATIIGAELLKEAASARDRLRSHAERIRSTLRERGWDVPDGNTPIIPVHVGDPWRAMTLSADLLERGFFVRGIRPPTVPEGTSRLRIVPTAAHETHHIDGLLAAMEDLAAMENEKR